MPTKIFMTQRTNRHIVKRLNSDVDPAVYDNASFGVYTIPGVTNSDLNFPKGITCDTTGNVYICDTKNQRIVKLDSNLTFVAVYSTINTIGTPYAITFDAVTGDLYIVGVYAHIYARIQRLTTALASVKVSGNLNAMNDLWHKPTGIVKYATGSLAVTGANLGLYLTTEQASSFTTFVQQSISGEYTRWPEIYEKTNYDGIVLHSNGYLYLNDGKRILKVNATTFANLGDSDLISETLSTLKLGTNNTLLTYDVDNRKIVRYDADLNYVEDVYWNQKRLVYNTLVGSFTVGEEVRTSSGYTYGRGIITANDGSQMDITVTREGFANTLSVVGVTSGATCTITNIQNPIAIDATDLGDLYEIVI